MLAALSCLNQLAARLVVKLVVKLRACFVRLRLDWTRPESTPRTCCSELAQSALRQAVLTRQACQYLYFCGSKASRLITGGLELCIHRFHRELFCNSVRACSRAGKHLQVFTLLVFHASVFAIASELAAELARTLFCSFFCFTCFQCFCNSFRAFRRAGEHLHFFHSSR